MSERDDLFPVGDDGGLDSPIPWWTWVVPIVIQTVGRFLSPLLTLSPGIYLFYFPYLTGAPTILWWGPRVLVGVYIASLIGGYFAHFPFWVCLLLGIAEVTKILVGWLFWKYLKIYKRNLKSTWGIFYCWFMTFALPNVIGSYLIMAVLTVGEIYSGPNFLMSYLRVTLIDTFMGLMVSFPLFIVMSNFMTHKRWTNWKRSPFE